MAAASYYSNEPVVPSYPPHAPQPPNHPSEVPVPLHSQPPIAPSHAPISDQYHPTTVPQTSSTSYMPLSVPSQPPPTKHATPDRKSRASFHKHNRWLTIVRQLTELITLLLSVIIAGIMIYVNIRYYETRNGKAGNETRYWPENTKVWPSWMMLAAGVSSAASSVFSFAWQIIRQRASKNYQPPSWRWTIFRFLAHIIFWAAVSAIYRAEKDVRDLWGWSCREKEKITGGELNFGSLCKVQGATWETSIVEVVVKVLFAGAWWWVRRKVAGEEKQFRDRAGQAGQGLLSNMVPM